MRPRLLGLWAALALLPTVPGALAQSTDAASAQNKGIDPALLAKAQAGDAAAEFQVGLNYEDGEGVPADFTKAAIWYRKAAEQEDARAQYYLGCLYLFRTTPLDYRRG